MLKRHLTLIIKVDNPLRPPGGAEATPRCDHCAISIFFRAITADCGCSQSPSQIFRFREIASVKNQRARRNR
jgi:hypothetical protein